MSACEQLITAKTPYNHRMNSDVSSLRYSHAGYAVQRNSIKCAKVLTDQGNKQLQSLPLNLLLTGRKSSTIPPALVIYSLCITLFSFFSKYGVHRRNCTLLAKNIEKN